LELTSLLANSPSHQRNCMGLQASLAQSAALVEKSAALVEKSAALVELSAALVEGSAAVGERSAGNRGDEFCSTRLSCPLPKCSRHRQRN